MRDHSRSSTSVGSRVATRRKQCLSVRNAEAITSQSRLSSKVTFVTRLQPCQSPNETARQLPDLSTIIWVEPSSTYMSGQVSRAHLVLLAREQCLTPLFLLSPIL